MTSSKISASSERSDKVHKNLCKAVKSQKEQMDSMKRSYTHENIDNSTNKNLNVLQKERNKL